MARIIETHDAVVIITMVTVYVAEESNIYWCIDIWKRS